MRSNTARLWTLIAALVLFAPGLRIVSARNPRPQPQPVCFETLIGNKCGTDTVLEWVSCGNAVCNTREVIFDLVTSVRKTTSGFARTEVDPCTRSEIIRQCVFDPDTEQSMCSFVSENVTPVMNGERAVGPSCGDGNK